MAKAKKKSSKKDDVLQVNGTFDDVMKVAMSNIDLSKKKATTNKKKAGK